MKKKKIMIVYGTRPEIIKLAPLINSLKNNFSLKTCFTGQHKQMGEQMLKLFKIESDYNLKIMNKKKNLNELLGLIIIKLEKILDKEKPNLLIVQGDTTTALGASIAAMHKSVKIAHVEAGLRSHNLNSPWPEEINRKIISNISTYHFAPTTLNKINLLKENITNKIYVTGNTVIDALLKIKNKLKDDHFRKSINSNLKFLDKQKKLILVTGHRRENLDYNLKEICLFLNEIDCEKLNIQIIFQVHLNPKVKTNVKRYLKNKKIILLKPSDYPNFIDLLSKSYIVISDSGGIQEETSYLGKPLILTRSFTERPQGLKYNTIQIKKISKNNLLDVFNKLFFNKEFYKKKCKRTNAFGKGDTSTQILNILKYNEN